MSGERGFVEEVGGAAGAEGFGDTLAEFLGCDIERSALDDVGDLIAVRTDNHRVQVPVRVGGVAEGAEREVAAATEGVEERALGASGVGYIRAVEHSDGGVDGGVLRGVWGGVGASGFEGERTLAGGGTELVNGEALVDVRGAIEAVEACSREDEGVGLALLPFAEASVDVAAELDEAEVGTEGEEHGLAARRRRPDARAHGQHVEAPEAFADEGVAGVGARGDGGEGEALVERCGQIFERMHGDVDATGGEGVLDLFNEDALGVEWRAVIEARRRLEGRVLHAVAGGANDLDGDLVATSAELLGDVVGLPERELGTASADA